MGRRFGRRETQFHRHPGAVVAVAFSPDSRRIISSGDQGSLMVWNAESGDESLALKGHTGFVEAVAFSPDGRIVASGGTDLTVRIWDSASGRELRSFADTPGSFSLSPSVPMASDWPLAVMTRRSGFGR